MITRSNYIIEMTKEPLNLSKLNEFVIDETCGAVDIFIGSVRNHAEGRPVSGVEYHGFPEMGENILETIIKEAFVRWEIYAAAVQHRIGMLGLKEASIMIAVSSPHRVESFEACRFIIEEIKKRLPVWKKEHFLNGKTRWKHMENTEADNFERRTNI